MKARVIAIDDDEMFLTATRALFNDKQIPLATYTDSQKALRAIAEAKKDHSPFRMAIVDYNMPTKGHEVVRSIKQIDPSMHTVVLSACLSNEEAKLCTHAGADHIYLKQKSKEMILLIAEVASLKVKHGKLTNEEKEVNNEWIKKILGLRGYSSALAQVGNEVSKYAMAGENVLVTGQSGVGKEQVARSLHDQSKRSGNFVAINCGAIAKDLVESELFGHTKGSFSGATSNKAGKFMAANFGTLFLDEIGEMPLDLQVKLLRVIQEREVVPIGSNSSAKVDVRIVAATNRDLLEEVKKGSFREDLYYRLNILPIHIPPLSERKEDIEPIAKFIIEQKNQEMKLDKVITDDAIKMLMLHAWPGNIRELGARIRKAYTLADKVIDRSAFMDLCSEDDVASSLNGIQCLEEFPPYEEFVEKIRNHLERIYLEKAMILANGKRAEAAKLTKLPYTTYIHKRKKLGLTAGHSV